MRPQVEIISHSQQINKLVASAARISTQQGTAHDIWFLSTDEQKDLNLIEKVLSSGHETILEHACFTLAFTNVSAFVEQFFIEHRLASFTVKSRRYVDFRSSGYYLPESMPASLKMSYQNHIQFLFNQYGRLVENGIPKEDARFVLPYCFFSNFFCTVNARELKHIIHHMLEWANHFEEIALLVEQLFDQLNRNFRFSIPNTSIHKSNDIVLNYSETRSIVTAVKAVVKLNSYIDNSHVFDTTDLFKALTADEKLEHILTSFTVENISLAGLTHLARHRMQSLAVPHLLSIDHSTYILPKTIAENPNPEIYQVYIDCFQKNLDFINTFKNVLKTNRVYLCLSGNVTKIISSINARALSHFFHLRCCKRAQWEIRQIANEMLLSLKQTDSTVFEKMGPSCVLGKCPEGKMTCGHPVSIERR